MVEVSLRMARMKAALLAEIRRQGLEIGFNVSGYSFQDDVSLSGGKSRLPTLQLDRLAEAAFKAVDKHETDVAAAKNLAAPVSKADHDDHRFSDDGNPHHMD